MRQKPVPKTSSAEKTIKDIRRNLIKSKLRHKTPTLIILENHHFLIDFASFQARTIDLATIVFSNLLPLEVL